jgi:hypothetical protein
MRARHRAHFNASSIVSSSWPVMAPISSRGTPAGVPHRAHRQLAGWQAEQVGGAITLNHDDLLHDNP